MELVSANNSSNMQIARLPPLPGQVERSREVGGRYTLANSSIAHAVPPRGAIQASIEYQSGVIDTWPAHSTSQRPGGMQLSINKFNNLVVTNANAEASGDSSAKPKFLENLEKFVQRELKALGCAHGHGTSEIRLQAYREAFEYLLEEFKTYKPILSMIKNEYEMMLAMQREKIRELEPLKQMLVTLADQCDYKLMQYREEEKNEIKQLREEKKRMLDEILDLKNGNQTLQIQVEKLQLEMSKEHEKFRNEQDKRKLLILDLNDLRFQQEEAKLAELKRDKKRMQQGMPDEDDTQDDPVTLKIALRMCRKNLDDAMKRLTRMEADYGDVVPRRDYEKLKVTYENLVDESNEMKESFKKYKVDLDALEKTHKKLENRFQDIERQLEEYRRDCTPRPDWDRCTSIIEAEKWANLVGNKTSIQVLETLVYEMGGKKDGMKMTEYHTAMGMSAENPPHLRTDGNKNLVKKICLNKREISVIVKEFWKQRESDKSTEFSEGLINFLRKKFNTDMQAFEYSYAMHEAFDSKNLDSEFLAQFASILNGKLDEDAYYNENKMIKKLLESLKHAQASDETETVTRSALQDSLRGIFKYVPKAKGDYIDSLLKIVDDELGTDSVSDNIEYKSLFLDDFKDKHGMFINSLRTYFREERALFSNKIREHAGNKGEITLNDLKLATNQEQVPNRELDSIIKWCFRSEKTVDGETFGLRIDTCGYYPVA